MLKSGVIDDTGLLCALNVIAFVKLDVNVYKYRNLLHPITSYSSL